MNIKEQVLNYKADMIKDLETLVSYNSVMSNDSEYPFGLENAKCLDTALEMMTKYGLKTTNLDYYAGFGEVGTGDEVIGILGHLDVVPATGNWLSDPFTLTQRDNKLFGRGSSDDKGPVIASLYALRILIDNNVEFNKKVRLIVGSNEENGSKCLDYYVEKEGHINYGFTPDGSFPGIHGEKGIIHALASFNDTKIISIKGGFAYNVVCDNVEIVIENDSFDLNKFDEYVKNNELNYHIDKTDNTKITFLGVAGHASTPEVGKNAISHLMQALAYSGYQDEFVNYYNDNVGLYTDGTNAGVKCNDEFGDLTFSIGMINKVDDKITFTIDIRYPVTLDGDTIIKKLNNKFNLSDVGTSKPLYFPKDHPMIVSLVSAYQKVTNDYDSKLQVIGGGTYSKGINNCIAFGGDFNDENTNIHDANEFIKIDNLLLQTEIYVEAILNLLAI